MDGDLHLTLLGRPEGALFVAHVLWAVEDDCVLLFESYWRHWRDLAVEGGGRAVEGRGEGAVQFIVAVCFLADSRYLSVADLAESARGLAEFLAEAVVRAVAGYGLCQASATALPGHGLCHPLPSLLDHYFHIGPNSDPLQDRPHI